MHPAERYMRAVTLIGLLLAVPIVCVLLQLHFSGVSGKLLPPGQDFINYWAAPRLALEHDAAPFAPDHYNREVAKQFGRAVSHHNLSYPPHMLLLLLPVALLPYLPALLLWSLLGLTAYALSFRLHLPARARNVTFLSLLAPVVPIVLLTGQNGFFVAALSLAALYCLKDERPWLAGLCIGLLTIKPQLGLLWPLLLIATGAWRSLFAAALTAAALVALSLLCFGPELWLQFFEAAPKEQWLLVTNPPQDITYQLMTPSVTYGLRLLGVPLDSALVCQAVIGLFVATAFFRAARRNLNASTLAILIGSGGLLISPYGFNYDLALLTAGLLLRWAAAPPPEGVYERYLQGFVYLLPVIIYALNGAHLPLAPLALVLLFFGTTKKALRGRG